MSGNEGGNRLREGQVLSGILDDLPGLTRRGLQARSWARANPSNVDAREQPVTPRRRLSLWVRMLAALGEEFPRYEAARATASRSVQPSDVGGGGGRATPRERIDTSTQGRRAR